MKNRKKGVTRSRTTIFLPLDLRFLLEQMAVKAGYVRSTGRLTGRPYLDGFLEDWLTNLTGLLNYTAKQRLEMSEYQQKVEDSRR